jgi:hypothetical protein
MEKVKDFILTDDLDLEIRDGDFYISESDQDHIIVILQSGLGSFKEYPLVGVGIEQYLASPYSSGTIYTYMKQQLETDGYNIDRIKQLQNDYEFEIIGERIR